MYKAKERIESAEGFLVRKDLKASRKYSNVSVVNVSPLSASSHFFVMPKEVGQQASSTIKTRETYAFSAGASC